MITKYHKCCRTCAPAFPFIGTIPTGTYGIQTIPGNYGLYLRIISSMWQRDFHPAGQAGNIGFDTHFFEAMLFLLNIPQAYLFGMITHHMYQIIDNRHLTGSTFLLRMERKDLIFSAGQYIIVGLKDSLQHREYSIYSGEQDNYLEILIREIPGGDISPRLKTCRTGQYLEVRGPFGYMKLDNEKLPTHKFVFVASGTGIAPFHSFVTSYPWIDYKLLHGVKFKSEAYDHSDYDPERYVLCTSRERNGNYQGYVTGYLDNMDIDPSAFYYVCGNSSMIYNVYNILGKKGISSKNIFSEVYF